MPYVAIFEVLPPARDCMSAACWPTAAFFVLNPKVEGGQDIEVVCTASSTNGVKVARSSVVVGMTAGEVSMSAVTFEGANFNTFARVECDVGTVTPNDLKRR